MTAFATFALLYMAALLLELAEKWTYPIFTSAVVLLIILIVATGITRITFLIFLAVTTLHFLLVQFPDVANHVNLAIYCNLVLMIGTVYSLARPRAFPTDDDYFVMIRPLLQAAVILVYFLAGFHKLNADFINPEVSCAGNLLSDLARLVRFETAGPALVMTMAAVVILWEVLGGPLLAIPRLQGPLLAFSWTMHATLALIGFVDFGALALALLFTFVPPPYDSLVRGRLRMRLLGRSLHRAHLYFAINLVGGILCGLALVGVLSTTHRRFLAGIILNLAVLVLLWPLFSALAARGSRPPWTGVPIWSRTTPRWMLVFPAILMLHGLTSYVGLRTAGNFSMFSNLRTEGARSNHVLLGSNPFKLWGYQEDLVRFIRIDDRQARIGYQYQRLEGNELPVVEFRKLIYAWTRAGATIPMTFEYQGRIYSTKDIVNEPAWRTQERDWQMALMDFRVIQAGGPNRCRW